ncbi:glutamine synthetase [Hyaloraphidium curvatum]|nr:glutamine synthetase [Hyaloraphidium curvatum]
MAAPSQPLSEWAAALGVKYFLVAFTDLFGVSRTKLVPTAAIDEMCTEGAGFAGFATHLDMSPSDPDMFAIPDPSSAVQLPWNPEMAWVASDLVMDGKPVEQSPRRVLKRMIAEAAEKGFQLKAGVECEFFLLMPDKHELSDAADRRSKACYDAGALMRRLAVIREICDAMLAMGWRPYQCDHEDGQGQFEMNWEYDDALLTADRHVFFKFMAKQIAEKHGFRATFMPKPFADLTGSGAHIHVSCWSTTDSSKNLFIPADKADAKASGFSSFGHSFLGGVMKHCGSMVAITNPTVNSYKRLGASTTASGATWSPRTATYTGNNRTHVVRIPAPNRFELRLADGAVNPYLLPAVVLAAGLDGLEKRLDPGPPALYNAYTTPPPEGTEVLSHSMVESLKKLEDADKGLKTRLGDSFLASYLKLRREEWEDYLAKISQWEIDHTVDC